MENNIIGDFIMDAAKRLELIRSIGEEIITEQELRDVVETKTHPVAYDGFEPSGLAHLPFGVYRPLLLRDLTKAGVRFKLWIADWFGWINNKMGGDLEKIRQVGEYFIEVWKAAGVDPKHVEFVWASDSMDREYWKKVILIAKNTTVRRAERCMSIMGRKAGELKDTGQFFYPMMQTADIFHLKVDICQLGLDQRRANILAREVGPKLGWGKPVILSHHMLMGLEGVRQPDGYDTNRKVDVEISSKMSKSKPSSAIFVHDSKHEISEKIGKAFCPPKEIENNPVLDYTKEIIFRARKEMTIERPSKFGGPLSFGSYKDLEQAYRLGKLHPLDLKMAVVEHLDKLVKPVRLHFERNKRAKRLYDLVRKGEVTR
jgi:tyrosyl-tRNA synthetase